MSRRADHLAEMRHALAHNCSLAEARRQLARLRWHAQMAAHEKAAEARDAAPPRAPIRSGIDPTGKPWMMQD